MAAKIGLGIGVPLLAAVVWGILLAPNAAVRIPVFIGLLLQVVVFVAAAAGLAATGYRTLALCSCW